MEIDIIKPLIIYKVNELNSALQDKPYIVKEEPCVPIPISEYNRLVECINKNNSDSPSKNQKADYKYTECIKEIGEYHTKIGECENIIEENKKRIEVYKECIRYHMDAFNRYILNMKSKHNLI